jgi:DNA (cytosine-5)-methyltransferase 1
VTGRPPIFRASFDPSDMIVDNFAGGGGASSGITGALRPPDMAVNHNPVALAMHQANHPETRHYCEDVWAVDPREACSGRRVGLAWFSPDCTFFSKARGKKPLRDDEKRVRGLAWVVLRWARAVFPRVILLENVEEFEDWGPLGDDGLPDKSRAGRTFRAWCSQLRNLGYDVEFRQLVAANFGSPTTRKRLYLIARCDRQPIVWAQPTHGRGLQWSWRIAAECIDWSLPVRSIFDPTRPRPVAESSLRRIGKGLGRYVFDAPQPFLVPLTHHGDSRTYGLNEPFRTITGAHRGELSLVCPIVTKHYGDPDREGGGGQVVGHRVDQPLGTVTTRDHHALTAAFITKYYGTSVGSSLTMPMPTITANDRGGGHLAAVCAFLVKYYGAPSGQQQSLFDPLHTITTKSRFGLVTVYGQDYRVHDVGSRMLVPRELFNAQGFAPDYVIDVEVNGRRITKSQQIELCGNSVCRHVAEALVAANTRGERAVAA